MATLTVDQVIEAAGTLGLAYDADSAPGSWRMACPVCIMHPQSDRPLSMTCGEPGTDQHEGQLPARLHCRSGCDVQAIRDELSAALRGAEPWQELGTDALPDFPVHALPPDVAQWVRAIAAESQTPVDLAAMAALGVLSAAALGATVDCGGWTEESLGLYLLVSMPSGDRKSTVLTAALEPLRAIERERQAEAGPVVRELRSKAEVLEVRKRKLIKAAGNATDAATRAVAEDEIREVNEEIEKIGDPALPVLLADDTTPEALGGLLAQHGSMALIAAESAFLDNLSGRYSENGANLHLICAAYAGEATRIDRRNRDPEILDRPLVAIALAVQPHVLGALIAHPIARAQGLISRFAFSMPTSQLGTRDIDPPKASAETHQRWAGCVRHIADFADRKGQRAGSVGEISTSHVDDFKLSLSLSNSARGLLRDLRAEQEPRLAETGDLRPIADWISRHAGRVARIAALLHLAESAQGEISGQTMSAALEIGDYLLAHAAGTLTGPDEKVRRALEWLTARAQSMVSMRELHRGPLGGRGKAEDAAGLAERLVQHGALRAIPSTHTGPGRPPSPTYEVHPDLMRRADQADGTGAEVIPLDAVVSEIAELPEPEAERAWSALEAAGAR